MIKKFWTVFLAVVMLVVGMPVSTYASAKGPLKRVIEDYQTVSRTNEIITSTEIEGLRISCKYLKNTNDYFLYLEDEQYKLDVLIEGNNILFDIHKDTTSNNNMVYGQSVTLISLGALAPEIITAIEGCIIGVVSAAGVTGVTYVSVGLLEKITTSNKIQNINVSAANAAVSAATSGVTVKTEYDNSYFEAKINVDDTVYIGRLLTYKDALYRLRSGYDIFAIDEVKACFLAQVASPLKQVKGPEIHKGKGMRYSHYHPKGIEWYRDKKHYPHVWYI